MRKAKPALLALMLAMALVINITPVLWAETGEGGGAEAEVGNGNGEVGVNGSEEKSGANGNDGDNGEGNDGETEGQEADDQMSVSGQPGDPVGQGNGNGEKSNGSLVWNGSQGTDSQDCDKIGEGPRDEDGWIHWVFTTGGNSNVSSAELVLGGSGSGTYAGSQTGAAFHFYTDYFDLDNLTAQVNYNGSLGQGAAQLTISDYCPGEPEEDEGELEIVKRVVGEAPDGIEQYEVAIKDGDGVVVKTVNLVPDVPQVISLAPGNYSVEELGDHGAVVSYNPHHFVIDENQSAKVEVEIVNTFADEECGFWVDKIIVDADGEPIEYEGEAEFTIRIHSGPREAGNGNGNGSYEDRQIGPGENWIGGLAPGQYWIEEVDVPAGYEFRGIDPENGEFYLECGGEEELRQAVVFLPDGNGDLNGKPGEVPRIAIYNERMIEGELELVKVVWDDEDEELENQPDVDFEVNVSNIGDGGDYDEDHQVNPNEGSTIIGGLELGFEYQISEVEIPEGYELVDIDPASVELEEDNPSALVTVINRVVEEEENGNGEENGDDENGNDENGGGAGGGGGGGGTTVSPPVAEEFVDEPLPLPAPEPQPQPEPPVVEGEIEEEEQEEPDEPEEPVEEPVVERFAEAEPYERGDLPFTGGSTLAFSLMGLALGAGGLALKRRRN